MPDIRIPGGFLTVAGTYAVGSMPPKGFLDLEEWWKAQRKGGLRQRECGRCGRWFFPQELSTTTITTNMHTARGKLVQSTAPVCIECDKKHPVDGDR